ncbi:hypothetical protein [Lysobacter gummosus]
MTAFARRRSTRPHPPAASVFQEFHRSMRPAPPTDAGLTARPTP